MGEKNDIRSTVGPIPNLRTNSIKRTMRKGIKRMARVS